MIAAIVTDASAQAQLDELREAAQAMGELAWDDSRLVVADTVSADLAPGPAPAHRSIFSLSIEADLDAAILGRRIRAFRDSYGQALAIHIYNAVRQGGAVLLPFHAPKGVAAGYWDLPWLEQILGTPERVDETTRTVLFRRADRVPPPPSIFSWYARNAHALATDHLRFQGEEDTQELAEQSREFLDGPVERRPSRPEVPIGFRTEPDPPISPAEEIDKFFGMMNYCITGVSYKTEGLRRIIDGHLGGRPQTRVLDLGSGPGVVLGELLLSRPDVAAGVNCEVEAHYVPLARRLFYEYRGALKDRFKFRQSAAEDFDYSEPYDIICAFASLFLIPKEELRRTMEQAWASLRPGGCLVIHENIQRPAFETRWYYDQMFSKEELDALLGEFGTIEWFRSSDLGKMEPDQVSDLTVFRVVQKNG